MRKLPIILSVIALCFALMQLTSCKKNKLLSGSKYQLEFSQDTVLFDTIFTTIGSTTRYFKIYNHHNGILKISNVTLSQGTSSPFRINVDGEPGVSFSDIEIEPNDSLFVFVEVTIDPNNGTNPLVVEEFIRFNTNGNEQSVVLNAWGQDAYFHVKEIISSDETWNNDKPHVIYNYCAVDSAVSLTIPAGTRVHGHSGSVLYVYKGSLHVNGTSGNPVIFKQDRLEDYLLYPSDSVGGQWRGIYFLEAQSSNIDYAEITNATIGVHIDTNVSGQFVNMNGVRIDNSLYAAVLTQGANLKATNCLFGNAGNYSAFISIGGTVSFDHCTFGNYWNGSRKSGLFGFTDYYETSSSIQYRPFTTASFTNSIFYGANDNEFVIDTLDRSLTGSAPVFNFANCLIKTDTLLSIFNSSSNFTNCYYNSDPEFSNPTFWDFHVSGSSFTVGKAANSTVTDDLDGIVRSNATIGCYEGL